MPGLRLGIHVQKDFYIAYPACQLRRGRKNNVLSQGSRQADSSSFRHPCKRAVAVAVLRCFKSKQAPAFSGQFAVQDFRTPIHKRTHHGVLYTAKEHHVKRVIMRPRILLGGR